MEELTVTTALERADALAARINAGLTLDAVDDEEDEDDDEDD